jgi:hypothetical protein
VRDDVLVLGLDAGEQLEDESPGLELIAGQRREIADFAVEGLRQGRAIDRQRAVVVTPTARSRKPGS